MSENNMKIEFNSNLEEYTKLIEKLHKQTLALKATSEEVDGFEVKFELKEHEELPEYDQDEAVEFIVKAIAADYPHLETMNAGDIRQILDIEEDYMRSKGIIEE